MAVVSAVQKAVAFGKYLRDLGETDVISAHFNWEGTRISGDDKIVIDRQVVGGDGDVWFYIVEEIPGYTFVRAPVIDTVTVELPGKIVGEKNADARVWRWMATRQPGVIYDGKSAPNLKVDFIVIGYRTDALIKHLAPAGG